MLAFKSRVSRRLSALNAFESISVSLLRAKYRPLMFFSPAKTFSSSRFRAFRSRFRTFALDAPRKTSGFITEMLLRWKSISCSRRCLLNRCEGSSVMLFFLASTTHLFLQNMTSTNPVKCRGNYSATSNNMKLVHPPLISGLLHLVQRGGDPGPSSLYQM